MWALTRPVARNSAITSPSLLFGRRRLGHRHVALDDLLAQRVAVEAEDLGGLELVAAGALEDELDQRPLHPRDELVVQVLHRGAFHALEQRADLGAHHLLER